MAEEEKKEDAAAEGGEQQAAPQAEGGKLFSPKNLAIMGVMVVVLGAGAFFGIKMFTGSEEEAEESDKPERIEKSMPGAPIDFQSMVVNISGTQGTRYLKVSVSLELDDSKGVSDEVNKRKAQFQDIMTTEFSSVTLDQVDDPSAKNKLKFRLRQKFNDTLVNGEIRNIYFRDFVVQ
jgi:flagellar FliL protein